VVPEGQARIRAQVTSHHTKGDLQRAADLFAEGAGELHLALEKKK
jgi:7-keto-8-aminopelargonate synthetase-like enzyme